MSNTPTITLALSKGRIFDETLPLLKAAGIEVLEDPEKSRKLILATNQPRVRVVLVRASDVPTYVQYGGADIGVAGKDVLLEHEAEHGGEGGALVQPLDLRIAKCRLSVAVPADFDYPAAVKHGSRITVATKYTHMARQHFATEADLHALLRDVGDRDVELGLAERQPGLGRGGQPQRTAGAAPMIRGDLAQQRAAVDRRRAQ